MSELRRINRDLKERWGVAPMDALGRAHFRLAMTTQLEKRIGAVSRYTDNGIFLGTDKGVHTIPKYNFAGHFDSPKYVLERLLFAPLPEVPETTGGSYEPVHVFPHIEGKPVCPTVEILSLAINLLLYGPRKTADDYLREYDKKFDADVAANRNVLDDNRSYMQGQLQDHDAMVMPTNHETESPLMKQVLAIPEEVTK